MNFCLNIVISFMLFLSTLLVSSCSGTKIEEDKPTVIKVDGRGHSAEAAKSLADKLDIDLIQFSVPDSVVFSTAKSLMEPYDGGLIAETADDEIIIFDRDMKMISRFTPKGQGPEEVNAILTTTIDGDKVYIADFNKINVYTLDGKYLSTIDSIDGARAEIEVKNGCIYLKHRFSVDNQLDVLDMDGKPVSRPFETREVLRKFQIPSGTEDGLTAYKDGVAFAPALDNRIYAVRDTAVTVLAEFDFGSNNLPESFFEGDVEKVEADFHSRRNEDKGFVYFASLSLNDNWFALMPIGIGRDERNMLVDRRTGEIYYYDAYPEAVKALFGKKRFYIQNYLPSQDAFYITRSADNVADAIASLTSEQLEQYPALKKVDIESLDEDSQDFLILFRLK